MKLRDYELKYKGAMPFQAELTKVTNIVPHRHHSELELVYCLDGTINLEAAEQKVTLTSGQVHSIDFNDIHCLWSDDDNTTLIFHLDLKRLDRWESLEYILFACESLHLYPYQVKAMERVKDIVLSLAYIYFRGGAQYKDDYDRPVQELIDLLLQYFNWFNYENQDDHMNVELLDRFYRVLEYCNKNYKEKITVSQIAAQENINRNYFSQFIGKTVFSSFSNMVNYIRCWHAEDLLLTTDMPNAEISYACGFSDPKYFYAAFKDLWGCTPSEHRQQYEEYYQECLADPTNKDGEAIISDSLAADMLERYILNWHLLKTFK
ncbi:MAG: helix-turn-helix transcriptional regulator [Firmicutes bacterium]|nr:helix-turn-helix transcriptional regulator [Bacillota bacterium]